MWWRSEEEGANAESVYQSPFSGPQITQPLPRATHRAPARPSASSLSHAQVNFAVATYMQIENCTLDQRQLRESSQVTTHCTESEPETALNLSASEFIDSASLAPFPLSIYLDH